MNSTTHPVSGATSHYRFKPWNVGRFVIWTLFAAALLIGVVQTFAVALDYSLIHVFKAVGVAVTDQTFGYPLLKLTISQVAPILPYLFLVLILIFRPKGLLGTRGD